MPIGFALSWPGDVRRRAVDRLVQPERAVRRPALAERGRGQHPEAAGQHRRLVRQDVAEQVLGDDDVEVGGPADEQHRARIDELVVDLDVRELDRDLVDDRPPQPRRREDVGLVDAASAGRAGRAPARTRAGRRADLALRVRASCRAPSRPPGPSRRLRRLAEVDARRSARGRSAGRRRRAARARSGEDADERRDGRSPAAGWRTARGRRAARRAPAPAGPARAGSDHFGPPTAPSSTASAARARLDVLGRGSRPRTRRSRRRRPGSRSTRWRSRIARRPRRRTRRAAATTSGPTPSPGIARPGSAAGRSAVMEPSPVRGSRTPRPRR